MTTNLLSVIEQLLDMADSYATDVSYLDKMKNSHDSSLHDIEQASWAVNGSKSALENALTNALAAGKQALEQTQGEDSGDVTISVDAFEKLECCRRLLEIIATSGSEDPRKDAEDELVAHGFWNPSHPQATEPAPTPTTGMNIAQRILHVGGRNNAAGYVEFGSIQAVEALVRQVLRDLPAPSTAGEWDRTIVSLPIPASASDLKSDIAELIQSHKYKGLRSIEVLGVFQFLGAEIISGSNS